MKRFWPCAVAALIFSLASVTQADDAKEAVDAELAAIRETMTTFKSAFDSGDAQAVADHWTTEGEFVDESGRRLQGREALAKAYGEFFKANPGAKITSTIERLRLINFETAIEDGTDEVDPAPAGAPGASRYTAVHVKQDGKWLLWSVRETRVDTPSNYGHLQSLEAMVGSWVAENEGVEFQADCHWIANKNFVEQKFHARRGDQTIASGTQIIGWDPATERIASWTFTSDGGHATGSWQPSENGWLIESNGTLADGTPTSAVNIISHLGDNAVAWRSVNRTAGAFRILDTNEVVLKRKPASN
jgi:uncharacterized protein (TIGR02246 family)